MSENMKIKNILLLLILLIMMAGCGKRITSGEVIGKEFEPAHIEVRMILIVHTNGKTSYTTMMPYTYYYPDTYKVIISGTDQNGQRQTEVFRVTKEVYDSVTIGAEFVYTDEMEPSEPEYERKPGSNQVPTE